ncbi:MAG: VCBS repeat-containing protein, partial [Anaerolineae bacterium]|nr:VCBS repeat-containing protein [Anaerolineae bacterium]
DLIETYYPIAIIISEEFNLRYRDAVLGDMPFSLLQGIQRSLGIGANIFLLWDADKWLMALLEAGLRDEHISDFSIEFTIGNLQIVPMPVDFNGDGMDEYLLHVSDDFSWREFYALAASTFQYPPLPIIGVNSDSTTRSMAESGFLETVALADLDGDGGTEWIVEGSGYGYWAYCGDLYVIDWADGELVDRTGDLFSYCRAMGAPSSAEFTYTQPDAIQMVITHTDGWNCPSTRTDTLNLMDDTLDSATVYEDTAWCQLREAGVAFDAENYATAVTIYAQVIPEFEGQMAQYLTARLALAYALNGQSELSQETLATVEASGQMGELITGLRAAGDQPAAICRAAYDFFQNTNHLQSDRNANPYPWTPENFHFGFDPFDPRYFPLPDPDQAGCDDQKFVEAEPSSTPQIAYILSLDSFVRYDAFWGLRWGEYESVLAQTDELLMQSTDAAEGDLFAVRYWRGVTLELMGRPDEALAEYVAIYEAAPESAWGMLAALHFEKAG